MPKHKSPQRLFTLSQIDEDIIEGSKKYLELKELFENSSSLDDIIDSWMNRNLGRELSFSSRLPNENDVSAVPFIEVVLEEGAKEIAIAQCPKEALIPPEPCPFNIDEACHSFNDEDCTADDEWYRKRDDAMAIEFNEIYGEHQIPRGNVEKLLLSYLTAKTPTEIDLFFVDEDSLADSFQDSKDFNELMEKSLNYVCMNLVVYDANHSTSSSGEFISFFLTKEVIQ